MSGITVFLLNALSEDRGGRTRLIFFARSPQLGPVEIRITNFRPVFFIERSAQLPDLRGLAERKPVELKNSGEQPLDAVYFVSQFDLRRARDQLRDAGVRAYESDVQPVERFLMERFINGMASLEGEPTQEDGRTVFINPRLKPERVRPELRVASIDIETGVESGRLYSIAMHTRGAGPEARAVFFCRPGENPAPVQIGDERAPAELRYFPDERALLSAFFDHAAAMDPDLLIGWNVVSFDLRFLEKKCQALGMPFRLGRGGRTAQVRPRAAGGDFAEVPGRPVIDGPLALRAAFFNLEDLRLEAVAQKILGRGKLIDSSANKIAEIERLYRDDPLALARYNLEDCVLVSEIFSKAGLVELSMRRVEISGLLIESIGRSVAAFDHFLLPRLHRKGYAAISMEDVDYATAAPGGYVMEPRTGLHDYVVTLDFRSLYPSIIRTFGIDPYSLLKRDINPLKTPDGGYRFSRTERILPDYIGELMALRAAAKRDQDDHLSMAIKILMNSMYGVMGSPGCRFYHPDLPSAITRTGQWLLLQTRARLRESGYDTLYGDTDSLFVQLNAADLESPDERGAALARELSEYWRERLAAEFQIESFLELEYEKLFLKFFLPPARGGGAAKKRYVGLMRKAGVESLYFSGMETVRTDWTELAREFQRELYEKIFRGVDPCDWIGQVVKDLRAGQYDEKLVYRKRLRKPLAEYTANVPQHVRAARQLDRPGSIIRYVITVDGPTPVEKKAGPIDYDYYVEKQLKPIADTALGLFDTSFDALVQPVQLRLF